jgi:hypothetical protein
VIVAGLFAPERRELLTLLRGLSHEAWGRRTACEGWSVKDVTAHILRDDLGNLSGGRDGHAAGHIDAPSWRDLVSLVDRANEEWVGAARPLSPRILTDLLEWSGREVAAYFATVDPLDAGENVAGRERVRCRAGCTWPASTRSAGCISSRSVTRWRRRRSVIDACSTRSSAPSCTRFLTPTGRSPRRTAPTSSSPSPGPRAAAGRWCMSTGPGGCTRTEPAPAASVSLDEDSAWRLFTRGIDAATLEGRITCRGDQALGRHLLGAVAIIASMPAGA